MANFTGGSGRDVWSGTESSDYAAGGDGNDELSGLGGSDTLNGEGGSDTLYGGDGDDFLRGGYNNNSNTPAGLTDGADILHGGSGNDVIRGQDGADELYGDEGDDNLRGDAGNDRLDGGEGNDLAGYRFDDIGATKGVKFNASAIGTASEVQIGDGRGGTDTLISIEGVIITGTSFGDQFTGSNSNDQITTVGGDDKVEAGGGADVILDYAGSSTLNGGSGDDTFLFYDYGYFGGSGAGVDKVDGGEDFDTVVLNWFNVASPITVNLSTSGKLTAKTADGLFQVNGSNIESVRVGGSSGNDVMTGSAATDYLYGQGGNDTLKGGGGTDYLSGGAGDDKIDGGEGFDYYFLTGSGDPTAGYTIDASGIVLGDGKTKVTDPTGGKDTLTSIEGLSIDGDYGDDHITGSGSADLIDAGTGADVVNAGAGNDTIRQTSQGASFYSTPGGQITVFEGNDVIDGGADFDWIEYTSARVGITANLTEGFITSSAHGFDTVVNIEGVRGGEYDDVMVGSANADALWAGGGADVLTGRGGADSLAGDGGVDRFIYEAISDSTFAAADTIDASNEDIIDLTMIDANANKSGIQLFVLSNKLGAGKMTLTYDAENDMTYLDGDVNGDKVADFRINMYGDQTDFTNFATAGLPAPAADPAHASALPASLYQPHEGLLA